MSSSFQRSGCIEHHIILVKVCRQSPQLRHLNLGPVLNGCCPLLISLSLWPQCLLAFSANYQPTIYFIRGLSCPRRTWTSCVHVCARPAEGKNVNVSRSRVQFWVSTHEFAKYPWKPAQASKKQNKQKVGVLKDPCRGHQKNNLWSLPTFC